MLKALGIEYHLHCSWRPHSSEKVEKANDIIKRHPCKLTQETQDSQFTVLPIALIRAQIATPRPTPKEGTLYDRLFLCTDIVIEKA